MATTAGLKTIIFLSFILAIGFLLVILSCALFANWLPILVALTFVVAPIPNALCSQCAGIDDFSTEYSSGAVDFGHFITAMIVVSGFALPYILNKAEIIHPAACWMSLSGGALVYGTIIVFSHFFSQPAEEFS